MLIYCASVWKTRITGTDPVGTSSRSDRTRAIKTPCAYLLSSHTAGEDDGTDAANVCPPNSSFGGHEPSYCGKQKRARCISALFLLFLSFQRLKFCVLV